MTEAGLNPSANLTFNEVEDALSIATILYGGIKWLRGDLLNYAEDRWGEKWTQLIGGTAYNKGTISNEKSIARRVPVDIRIPELSHSHHAVVASLDRELQVKWLRFAVENGLSRDELREHVSGRILQSGIIEVALPPKSYTRTEVYSAFNQLVLLVERNDTTAPLLDKCSSILDTMR